MKDTEINNFASCYANRIEAFAGAISAGESLDVQIVALLLALDRRP